VRAVIVCSRFAAGECCASGAVHPEHSANRRERANGWNSSTNKQFEIDYFNRTGTAKSNMFDNRPNETQYF
jgi:hypothetical protein